MDLFVLKKGQEGNKVSFFTGYINKGNHIETNDIEKAVKFEDEDTANSVCYNLQNNFQVARYGN